MTDMEAVKARYPDAACHWIPWDECDPFGICQIYLKDDSKAFADGDTEEEAWAIARGLLEPNPVEAEER